MGMGFDDIGYLKCIFISSIISNVNRKNIGTVAKS